MTSTSRRQLAIPRAARRAAAIASSRPAAPVSVRRRSSRWAGAASAGARQPAARRLRPRADRGRPPEGLLPAHGDLERRRRYLAIFYPAFADARDASHLDLFVRDGRDLRAFVLAQDVIYVGGGNTANMLAIWRVHGLDRILREAWQAGVVMAGLSAGGLCWFECGSTDSFGPGLAPLDDLLGFVPGCVLPALRRRGAAAAQAARAGRVGGAARHVRVRRRGRRRVRGNGASRGGLVAAGRARLSRRARGRRGPRDAGSRPATWADPPGRSPSGCQPSPNHAASGRTASGPSTRRCRAAAVATVSGQPGGTSRGRQVRQRRQDEQPVPSLRMRNDQRQGRLRRVVRPARRPGARRCRPTGRRPAGRGRARGVPSARAACRPNARSRPLSATSRASAPVA